MTLPEIFLHSAIDKNTAITETRNINGNTYTIIVSDSYIDRNNLEYLYIKSLKKNPLEFSSVVIKEIKQIQIEYSGEIIDEEGTKQITSAELELMMHNALMEKNYNILTKIQDYIQGTHRKTIDGLVKEITLKFPEHNLQSYTWGYAPYRNLLVDKNYSEIEK